MPAFLSARNNKGHRGRRGTPPPLLKGGVKRCPVDIEVRGRDGTFGTQPQRGWRGHRIKD